MGETIKITNAFTVNELQEISCLLKEKIEKCDEVLIDISEAKKVDSAAIQMLIAAKNESRKLDHKILFKMSDNAKALSSLIGIYL